MTKDEFLALSEDDRFEWLKAQTASGRAIQDICDEVGMTRAQLQVHGYTFVMGEWHMLRMADRKMTMGLDPYMK